MGSKLRVAAICMQKNEGGLIRSWITHHANTFGAENVFVLDNVSMDAQTLAILDWAERCGVNIIWGIEEFARKGIEVNALIDSLRGKYDWFIPLDADEFVGVYRNNRLCMQRHAIMSELQMLCPDKLVRMSNYVWSIPGSPLGYYTEARKVIVPSALHVRLDLGFHLFSWEPGSYGNTVNDDLFQNSNLSYTHLHNKPYDRLLDSARSKLTGRVKSFDLKDLKEYSGDGRHVIRYFFMTKDEYENSFPLGTIDLERCFFDAGLCLPFSPADGVIHNIAKSSAPYPSASIASSSTMAMER